MSLRTNVVSGFFSQIFVSVVGLATLPILLRVLGAEGYGLVGFFATLQAAFTLLDLGFTTTVSRETARFIGGATTVDHFNALRFALTLFFLAVAAMAVVPLWLTAPALAQRWLEPEALSSAEVTAALRLMLISVALRWVSGLYRGIVTGAERIVWLSVFNAATTFLRFVAVFPVFWIFGATVDVFFTHQLAVSVLEFVVVYVKSRTAVPIASGARKLSMAEALGAVRSVWGFTSTIAVTSISWVLVTQADKFVLAGVLPLSDLGYFSLAVALSSGIMVLAGSVGTAIMPRMARLEAEGDHAALCDVYRRATRSVALFVIPAGIVLALFAREVLWSWSGDRVVVDKSHFVLAAYSAGYAVLAFTALAYYLQFAKGELRLHLIGSIAVVASLIPGTVWSATEIGLNGPGVVWLMAHLLYLILWIPVIHRRFLSGVHRQWMNQDILYPLIPAVVVGVLVWMVFPMPEGRVASAVSLGALYIALVLVVIFVKRSTLGRFDDYLWN